MERGGEAGHPHARGTPRAGGRSAETPGPRRHFQQRVAAPLASLRPRHDVFWRGADRAGWGKRNGSLVFSHEPAFSLLQTPKGA